MVRFDTCDGEIPIEDEFADEDSQTLPIQVPPDISPEMLRLLNQVQCATVGRIADGFRCYAENAKRPVLIGTDSAEAYVRSMQWARAAR
jgi:hypothetical protein